MYLGVRSLLMTTIKQRALLFVIVLLQVFFTYPALASSKNASNQNYQLSEPELAQVLAPIALYPDSLLTHIVIASTYPLEVVQAQRWRDNNSNLEPALAVELAEKQGWDPSVTALVAFPNVLDRLSDDLAWTQSLGDAFLEDEERVLDAIQTLRLQAKRANSLQQMENLQVTQVNRQIIIEPIRKEVIYVPYYDTRVVYGNWRWNRYPPVYWDHRPHFSVNFSTGYTNRFRWTAGININFNYFFSAFNWGNRHLVVTHHHNTRHYRSHKRIANHHAAARWQHNITHRRGVAYRSHKLNARVLNQKKFRQANEVVRFNKRLKQEDYRVNATDRHKSNRLINNNKLKTKQPITFKTQASRKLVKSNTKQPVHRKSAKTKTKLQKTQKRQNKRKEN